MVVMTYLVATLSDSNDLNLKQSGAFQDDYDCYSDDEKENDEEELVDPEGRYTVSIRSGAIEEKLAALNCIGVLCSTVGKPMVQFLPKVIPVLIQMAIFPYPQVRQASLGVCRDLVSLLALEYGPAEETKPGVVTPLHPAVQAVFYSDEGVFMEVLVEAMMEDDDKETVALACETLLEAMKRFGLAAIQPKIDEFYKAMLMLVNENALCQQNYDQDDPEAADHDSILIDSVTDVVGMIAQVVGPQFEPIFKEIFGSIAKFFQPHRAESDRSMAVGCFAEVCEAIGERSIPYFEQLLPIVFTGLSDAAIPVRRNASFCLGVLVEVGGDKLFSMYKQFLDALMPNLQIPEGIKKKHLDGAIASKENAVSAICKMITTNSSGVPVAQLVPEILKCCPLTSDLSECKAVYRTIMFLFQADTGMMQQHLPDIINIFAAVLHNADVDEKLRIDIAAFCKSLQGHQQMCGQVEQTLGMLTPEIREAFLRSIAALN